MSNFTFHIFLSSIESETRLYKEASYTLANRICTRVAVLGLWKVGLAKNEIADSGLEIKRYPTLSRRFQNSFLVRRIAVFRRILALLSLVQFAIVCIATVVRMRPDHVSCHNALLLPVAWCSARMVGATLEYLPHELEAERTGLSGIAKFATTAIERCFIRKARNVVVVCEPIRKWYEDKYNLTQLYVIRNVPEKEAIKIREIPDGDFRSRFNIPDDAIVFIYQGLFSTGRGIEMLLNAFSSLDAGRCHLVLMGYGDENFQSVINEAVGKFVNIHCQPAVPRDWIVSYSAGADVGIFISERASLSYRYSLPNKFFEWAHAGLPILVSENLEYQASLISEGGFGWSTSLENLQQTLKSISVTDLASYIQNSRRYAVNAIWESDAKIYEFIYKNTSK